MVEWENWKTVYGTVKEDPHHSEWVDISTGEVVKENVIQSDWERYNNHIVDIDAKKKNYYKDKIIHRNNVGDCFCSKDYSKIDE